MSDVEVVLWFFGLWILGIVGALVAYVAHMRLLRRRRPPSTPQLTPSRPHKEAP